MAWSRGAAVAALAGLVVGVVATLGVAAETAAEDPLPTVAFLATATNFPDALAAGAVAGSLGAPVLLTGGSRLDPAARTALETLSPDLVVLVGGTAALSDRVDADVRDLGLATERVAGAGRTQTAERLAAFASDLGHGRPVVTGRSVGAGTIPGLDAETLQGLAPGDLQGLPGWDRVSQASAFDATSVKSATANCPAGKKVLGGGFHLAYGGADPDDVIVWNNHPFDDDSWIVSARNITGVGTWQVTAYALCAAVD